MIGLLKKSEVYLELIADFDLPLNEIVFAKLENEIVPCVIVRIDGKKIKWVNLKSCSIEESDSVRLYRMKYIDFCQNN